MYCPNCAAEYTFGLKYCKRCGTNLGEGAPTSEFVPPAPAQRVTGAAWVLALATVAITLGGLGIVFTHAFDLMRARFPGDVIASNATPVAIVMLVFGSLTVFGVIALLMRLFSHVIAPRQQAQAPPAQAAKPFMSAPPVQLPAPPQGVGSVTEHTTRNFEPGVYDRMRARE